MEREPYPTPPGSMFNGLGVPAFESVTRQSTFPPGIGLPGSVWAIGSPVWIADVTIDANFPRAQFAAQDGLHGAFGFPIRCGNEITGVIEFFSREIQQPDEDLLKMMATIGSQIGQFTERRRAEQALGESGGSCAPWSRRPPMGSSPSTNGELFER